MAYRFIVILALGLLQACGSMPKHNNVRSDTASSFSIKNAPASAQVYLDSKLVGTTDEDGDFVRTSITDGTHSLDVMRGGQVIYSEKLFVQDGTHKEISLK